MVARGKPVPLFSVLCLTRQAGENFLKGFLKANKEQC